MPNQGLIRCISTAPDEGVLAAAVEHLIDQFVPAHLRVPPVNLPSIARHLGVGAINPTRRPYGYTDLSGGAPEIFLQLGVSPTRRTFMLAHEIGHVLLHEARIGGHEFHAALNDEAVCDHIAGHLLLPDGIMRGLDLGFSLARLNEFAAFARVSTPTLMTRLSLHGSDMLLLRARPLGDHLLVTSRSGSFRGLTGALEILVARLTPAARVRPQKTEARLIADDMVLNCHGEVSSSAAAVLLLTRRRTFRWVASDRNPRLHRRRTGGTALAQG